MTRQANLTLSDFLLVTTSQETSASNSSQLADVRATSLFGPYVEEDYSLRTISDSYNSLPRFNLTNGNLHTRAVGEKGVETYKYNSTGPVTAGQEFILSPSKEPTGNLALKDGYLLTVDGEAKGWALCPGDLDVDVVSTFGWAGGRTGANDF